MEEKISTRCLQALKTYQCVEESSRNAVCVQAWAETMRVIFRNLGVTAIHQGRSHTPGNRKRQDDKSFRIRERDERTHKDACPLHGASQRGHGDMLLSRGGFGTHA